MRNRTYRPRRTWRERLYSFMYGRNGVDALCRALLVAYFILFAVNLFVGSIWIYGLEYAVMIYAAFRMLSRNLAARRRENAWYFRIESGVRSFFRLQKNKWRDRKTHVYHKCPHCKKTLRLPKVKGEHTVNCPCCHTRFDMKV